MVFWKMYLFLFELLLFIVFSIFNLLYIVTFFKRNLSYSAVSTDSSEERLSSVYIVYIIQYWRIYCLLIYYHWFQWNYKNIVKYYNSVLYYYYVRYILLFYTVDGKSIFVYNSHHSWNMTTHSRAGEKPFSHVK